MLVELQQTEYNVLMKYQIIQSDGFVYNSGIYIATLPEDRANILRNKCGELLQLYGFDENYMPNELGEILENLIDKLYIK